MHIEKRTLLKSPHIYKKHRVQYELRTHARMLQVRHKFISVYRLSEENLLLTCSSLY